MDKGWWSLMEKEVDTDLLLVANYRRYLYSSINSTSHYGRSSCTILPRVNCSINTLNGGGCMHSPRRDPVEREKRKRTRSNALGRTRAGSGGRAGRVAIALVYAIERIDASTPRRGTG